jgi:CDGSH iron-sulfur domain-containing protein 3
MTPVIAQKSPMAVPLEAGKTYWWCACGKSAKQPYCDGSHKGSGFTPKEFTAQDGRTAYLCCCKHTKSQPFCDGTHKTV